MVSNAVEKALMISMTNDEISLTDLHMLQAMVLTRTRSHIKKQFKRVIF